MKIIFSDNLRFEFLLKKASLISEARFFIVIALKFKIRRLLRVCSRWRPFKKTIQSKVPKFYHPNREQQKSQNQASAQMEIWYSTLVG